MIRTVLWIVFSIYVIHSFADISTIYELREVDNSLSSGSAPSSSWVDVEVTVVNKAAHTFFLQNLLPYYDGSVGSSAFVEQPVFVSLTTMAQRFETINSTIINILQGKVVPTKIFLVVSKDPYLLDTGITHIPKELLCLSAAGYLNIVFTPNIGPHRNLLPVLRKFYDQDVFIVTMDDDVKDLIVHGTLRHLLSTYKRRHYPDAVVALRVRRMSICTNPPHKAAPYNTWPLILGTGYKEMLLMPTGNGGILYRPHYFHEVVFDPLFRTVTGTADDLMFRLATMMKNVPVLVSCGGTDNLCRLRESQDPHAPAPARSLAEVARNTSL